MTLKNPGACTVYMQILIAFNFLRQKDFSGQLLALGLPARQHSLDN